MVSAKLKRQMRDYVVKKLESSHNLNVKDNQVVVEEKGIKATYMWLDGDEGLVFLVDRKFTGPVFEDLYRRARQQAPKAGFVFLKDGKTFFRNAATGSWWRNRGRSLKRYDSEDMKRMIQMTPEELFVEENRPYVQYYQPESAELEEGIETFQYENVEFDYSHVTSRFRPSDKPSVRIKIWTNRNHNSGNIRLNQRGNLEPIS